MLDVSVGHACYVVGYCAGRAFLLDSGLVVGWEQGGVGGPGLEESLDYFYRVAVLDIESRREIEVGVEEFLGLLALGFHGLAELGDPGGGLAQIFEGEDVAGANLARNLLHEVGYESVEHLLEGFISEQSRFGLRKFGLGGRVKAGEERDLIANLAEVEDVGGEAVFKVGGEVGDFVGQVDELGFERGLLVQEIFG